MDADPSVPADVRPARGRPRAEHAHEVEQRILEAAGKLFLKQGYSRTTYEQLVKEAHVSKTTLYARFPTKPQLFAAVVRSNIAIFREHVVVGSGTGTPQERLVDLVTQLADATLTSSNMALMRITVAEAESFPELAREGFRIGFGDSVKSISECLEEVASFPSAESARPWAERFVETTLHPLYTRGLFGEDLTGLRAKARRDICQVAAILFSKLAENQS